MSLEVDSVEENVIISAQDGTYYELTTRNAFDLVTALLKSRDSARAFGEHKRGEVAEPNRHKRVKRS